MRCSKRPLGDDSALLRPEHRRRFERALRDLNKLIAEVREYVPEANYYLQDNSMHILSGEPHDGMGTSREVARVDRSMASEVLHHGSGGAW